MQTSLKRYIALFLICTLFLTSGVFNTAMATGGNCQPNDYSEVKYTYNGAVPSGAPKLPEAEWHKEGSTVTVANAPTLAGYTFSGWWCNSVDVKNNQFTMPEGTVVFHGSWTKTYSITYQYAPGSPNATLPVDNNRYEENAVITLPTPTFDGYTFLGWKLDGKGNYITFYKMGCNDVKFIGYWKINCYTVTYTSTGDKPAGYSDPTQSTVEFGKPVTRQDPQTYAGYTFSGWTPNVTLTYTSDPSNKEFTMPATNVVFTGTW